MNFCILCNLCLWIYLFMFIYLDKKCLLKKTVRTGDCKKLLQRSQCQGNFSSWNLLSCQSSSSSLWPLHPVHGLYLWPALVSTNCHDDGPSPCQWWWGFVLRESLKVTAVAVETEGKGIDPVSGEDEKGGWGLRVWAAGKRTQGSDRTRL